MFHSGATVSDDPRPLPFNWLLLIIIFVFDPLAIALVIAANFAFAQLREQYRENIYGETVPIDDKVEDMRKIVEAYGDLEDEIKDWDATLNDGLDDDDLFWDEEDLEILKLELKELKPT